MDGHKEQILLFQKAVAEYSTQYTWQQTLLVVFSYTTI